MPAASAPAESTNPSTIGKVRGGVSGWRHEPWRGAFYPAGLRQDDELAYASQRLPTIELNGSF